jgi:type II secretion system protein G
MGSSEKGFTLIELLIVVVIIGILAAIAIPKFANTKEKAYVASMKSDLRNLVNAEEAYFADWTTYVGTFPTTQYSASPGVTVTIANPDGKGWEASAAHTGTAIKCGIALGVGHSNPVDGTAPEGEPRCK